MSTDRTYTYTVPSKALRDTLVNALLAEHALHFMRVEEATQAGDMKNANESAEELSRVDTLLQIIMAEPTVDI